VSKSVVGAVKLGPKEEKAGSSGYLLLMTERKLTG
jgi:hypothetical protein